MLPKEWTGQQVRAVMQTFTESLGVQCAHCHAVDPTAPPPELMTAINVKRMEIRGFTQRDLVSAHYADFQREMPAWIAEGRIKYREDVVEGLENAVDAFLGLLRGENFGKLLVRVSEEPPRSTSWVG